MKKVPAAHSPTFLQIGTYLNARLIKHVYLAIRRHTLLYVGYPVLLQNAIQYNVSTSSLRYKNIRCLMKYETVRKIYPVTYTLWFLR